MMLAYRATAVGPAMLLTSAVTALAAFPRGFVSGARPVRIVANDHALPIVVVSALQRIAEQPCNVERDRLAGILDHAAQGTIVRPGS